MQNDSSYEIYATIRNSLGYKDSDVSNGADVSKSTFSDWKAGRYIPKLKKMQKIADFFNIPVEHLTTGEKSKGTYMTSVDKVKEICKKNKIPISKLEKDLGYSNGYVGGLRKGVFPGDRLQEIAEYLNVSTSYLLGIDKGSEEIGAEDFYLLKDRSLVDAMKKIQAMPAEKKHLIINMIIQMSK